MLQEQIRLARLREAMQMLLFKPEFSHELGQPVFCPEVRSVQFPLVIWIGAVIRGTAQFPGQRTDLVKCDQLGD